MEELRGQVVIGLSAVVIALHGTRALTLTVGEKSAAAHRALPFGSFNPRAHRTFEIALRDFVQAQTGFELGYVEQLYTFGDRGREAPRARLDEGDAARVISVGYLALAPALDSPTPGWVDWYRFFPWEDWRGGRPPVIDEVIDPYLRGWADQASNQGRRAARWDRARLAFALAGADWNEERVLDRYELLYEAGFAPEAAADLALTKGEPLPDLAPSPANAAPMASDHRRILATALSRFRGKIKYRPVLFELMGDLFTLSALQQAAETVLGLKLHKQNFRRALNATELVEGTGQLETATGGRPAELYRFKREILRERPSLGIATPRLRDGGE